MDVKMYFRIITKNHAADSKIGSLLKIDFRADWTHESNPKAWELTAARWLSWLKRLTSYEEIPSSWVEDLSRAFLNSRNGQKPFRLGLFIFCYFFNHHRFILWIELTNIYRKPESYVFVIAITKKM